MTPESPRLSDLAQISSYSQLILNLSVSALTALRTAEPALRALASAARTVHVRAARGEPSDVLGLLVAVGRAEEALAPLQRWSATAADGLAELRDAVRPPPSR